MTSAIGINQIGLGRDITDHTTFRDSEGRMVEYFREIEPHLCSVAVTEGDFVTLVAATTTAPVSIKPTVTGDLPNMVIGVATQSQVVGKYVNVCTRGVVLANIVNGQTPEVGEGAIVPTGATPGQAEVATWAPATALATFVSTEIEAGNPDQAAVHLS